MTRDRAVFISYHPSMKKRDSTRKKRKKKRDVALVLDRTEDADGYRILRHRQATNEIELGSIVPLKEGRPIEGEVVSLSQHKNVPFLYDVETELPDPRGSERRPVSQGPAQVATDDYRRGWEAIWGHPAAAKLN